MSNRKSFIFQTRETLQFQNDYFDLVSCVVCNRLLLGNRTDCTAKCSSENFVKLLTGFIGGGKEAKFPFGRREKFRKIRKLFGFVFQWYSFISHDVFFVVILPSQFDVPVNRDSDYLFVFSCKFYCQFMSQYLGCFFSIFVDFHYIVYFSLTHRLYIVNHEEIIL
jgi:hypothetical protein